MVQPFNYSLPGAVSPFESVVQGLKLGATMEELAAARAQRTAQAEALRLKEQEERRRMDLVSALGAKPLNQWTSQDIVNASGAFPKEQLSFLQSRMDALSSEEKQRLASETGQAVTVALSGSRVAVNDWFDPRISAETDQNKRRQLEVQKQAALNAPEQFAKTYIPYLGQLGEAGKTVAENLFKMLPQLAGVKPEPKPEIQSILEAVGLPVTMENIARVTAAQSGPSPDIKTMEALNIPRTEAGFKRYQELQAEGRGPLVSVTAGGQPTPPTEFEKKLESFAAEVYADWALRGGAANARARIAQLDNVIGALEKSATGKGATLSGVMIQATPEFLRPLLFPQSVEARQNAERVFQDGLRAILGAQFTQVEGENFLKRAFDPALGPDVNARRASLIVEQMKESAKQAQALADYVEKNGTSRGFKGTLPSIAQFEAVLSRVPAQRTGAPGSATPPPGPAAATPRAPREIITTLPTPADQPVTTPGAARAGAAPGSGAGMPITTTPTPGTGGRARTVDEILQQYRSRQ